MRQLGRWLLIPVLAAAGAVPGFLLAHFADNWGFLGVALLGALAGLGLAVTGLVYRTSFLGSIRRVAKGIGFTLIEYNIGFGRTLTGLDQEPAAEVLLRPNAAPRADAGIYYRVTQRSAALGVVVLVTTGFVCGWFLRPDDTRGQQAAFIFIFMLGGAVAGFVYGWAVGALTVPGRHRPHILLGFTAGLVIGCGPLFIALGTPGPRSAVIGWCLFGLFTTVCTGAGMFAQESLPDDPES